MKTYNVGDTITIDVELRDESGIQTVEMIFRQDQNTLIRMPFLGPSESSTVRLTFDVTDQTPPGVYTLSAFYATDGRGNRSDFQLKPDWDFEVINKPVDTADPELVSVNVQ
jgi:hypothetical protein